MSISIAPNNLSSTPVTPANTPPSQTGFVRKKNERIASRLIHSATDMMTPSSADNLRRAFFSTTDDKTKPTKPSFDPRAILQFVAKQPNLKAQDKINLFKKLTVLIAQTRIGNAEKINTHITLTEIEEAFSNDKITQQETLEAFSKTFPELKNNSEFQKDLTAFFSAVDQELISYVNPLAKNGTAEQSHHIKNTHRNTETPPSLEESMETSQFIEEHAESLRFVIAVANGELSKDTARETIFILLIFHCVPILDLFAAVYYLHKYGLYNNSISLVDNLIINSHPLSKMGLLNEYMSTMTNNHDKLMGIKGKIGETLKTQNSANETTPEMIDLKNLFFPSAQKKPEESAAMIKKSQQFYDLLQDRLATIKGQLDKDNVELMLRGNAKKLFTKAFFPNENINASNENPLLVSDNGENKTDPVSKIINYLVPAILATRECTHYEEVRPGQNPQNPQLNIKTNAFKVLNNQIKNAEMNMHDLIHTVPFRDFGWQRKTLASYLNEILEDPMSANFGGINAQSDVFKFAVKIGEKEYDIKALRQDTAVTKKLLQSFTDRYGDERGIKIHAPVGSSSQTPAETNTGNNQAGDPLQVQLT